MGGGNWWISAGVRYLIGMRELGIDIVCVSYVHTYIYMYVFTCMKHMYVCVHISIYVYRYTSRGPAAAFLQPQGAQVTISVSL